MSDQMLRVPELAERLDLSPQSVYRLLQSGALPGLRVGGSWRVPASALERWIETQLETRPPAPRGTALPTSGRGAVPRDPPEGTRRTSGQTQAKGLDRA